MNERIENAINLRIGLIDYIRAVKDIDKTILGFELKHYAPGVKKIDEFAMWEEWRRLADSFQTVKDSFPNCVMTEKMPVLVKETKDKLKTLFKRTIVEALAEIMICDTKVDYLTIFNGGILLESSQSSTYKSEYSERYTIPKKISNILNTNDEYSVLDMDLIADAMEEFKRDNTNKYIKCTSNSGIYLILVNLPKP